MHYSKDFKIKSMIYLVIFVSTVFIDQFTKHFVLNKIGLNNSQDFIPGIVNLTVVQNTGGAFSIFQQHPIYFKIIGIINIFIFSYLTFCPTVILKSITKAGCAFILGGTIGNLIDRFLVSGVIDFIDLKLFNFAIFNLADVFIDIGVILILVGWFLSNKKH